MSEKQIDVVVIGAGQAGLAAAFCIAEAGLEVVVLERGRIGERWLSQRWDSFALNTPNWMNGLPGAAYQGKDPFGFMPHTELVASFDDYVDRFGIDVRTGTTVASVGESDTAGYRFRVSAESNEGDESSFVSRCVVVASGIAQTPRIPAISSMLPDHILQLSTGTYRSPHQPPEGAVVVVGGGQSGAQIVEDLLAGDREVYFSISKVARLPRRYRGRDFMDWWVDMGLWDIHVANVDDPAVLTMTNPLTSGVGPLGHTVSYQDLAARGAHILGRLEDVRDGLLITDDRVDEYVRHADNFSQGMREKIDQYIANHGIDAPAPESDPGDVPVPDDEAIDFQTELNLEEAGVSCVIWATGFTADFSWIDFPVLDASGRPVHNCGVSDVPGIYFIGFPWLSKRKSGIVYGVEEDARHIAKSIVGEGAS